MTNNQTIDGVPRELLENFASYAEGSASGEVQLWVKKLRALLDAPTEPFSYDGWSIDHSAGRPILMQNKCSVIEAEQAYGLLELIKTAAQSQGDTVPVSAHWSDYSMVTLEIDGQHRTSVEYGKKAERTKIELVPCTHEWTDDGEFLLTCTACGAQEDYTQALQLAFELGGTDDGAYHLETDELCEVIRRHAEQSVPVVVASHNIP